MGVISKVSILLNQVNFGPSSTGAFNGGTVDLMPKADYSWADELTYYVQVTAVNGSPTSGTLTGKFQFGIPASANGQQFSSVTLFDLDTNQKASLITEGEDWGTIASFGSSTPITVKRTIRGFGSICNLHLDASTLAGGTTPTFTVNVTLVAKSGTGAAGSAKTSATGSAIPSTAMPSGVVNNGGNLAIPGTTTRAITNGTTDTVQAAGMIGQYNSTAPTVSSGNWGLAQLDSMGTQLMTTGGTHTVQVASGTAANTVVKSTAGRLCRLLITATGTVSMSIFDNATTNSGTVIGIVPANPVVGTTYDFNLPAINGITVGGSGSNPGFTVSYI